MLEMFYPRRFMVSAYKAPYDHFNAIGVRGVIFDIDNTLVPHDAPADGKAVKLFEWLHAMGMKTCLLSNNKEPRVKSFADAVGSEYIYKAGKPGVRGYKRAMKLMGSDTDTTVFVGDQLFTDIYGANRVGIYSILVKPIDPREEIQIVLKRYLERPVLFFYHRSKDKRDRECWLYDGR